MTNIIAAAVAAVILAGGAVNPNEFEGVSRDSFAAWSYGWNSVKVNGPVRTLLVQTRYNTPTPFNGNPTPVAYSIHAVSLDCAAKTVTFVSGSNYTASGVVINAASPSPSAPWTDGTPGFQELATTVCATSF